MQKKTFPRGDITQLVDVFYQMADLADDCYSGAEDAQVRSTYQERLPTGETHSRVFK